MRNIKDMTRKEIEKAPHRRWGEEVLCDSLIILPTRTIHDSGYRCLAFAAILNEKIIGILSGCSDVIHIEGIGGWGERWEEKYNKIPDLIPPRQWSIDCLAKSGLLRLFCRGQIKCGPALSSFEIYQVEKKK